MATALNGAWKKAADRHEKKQLCVKVLHYSKALIGVLNGKMAEEKSGDASAVL